MSRKQGSLVLALLLFAGVESIEKIAHARTVEDPRSRFERQLNASPKPPNQSRQTPKVYLNDQERIKEKAFTNNKEYQDSMNIDTQLRDMFGIGSYPEQRTLFDSNEASMEHERLRRKMLTK